MIGAGCSLLSAMSVIHDPGRQANYLQQCLSLDKRPIGFFLGAGCPLAVSVDVGGKTQPIIPDVAGLSGEIGAKLNGSPLAAAFTQLQKNLQADGLKSDNVEQWLSFVRMLRAISGGGVVRDLAANQLAELEAEICRHICERVDQVLPNTANPYQQLAAWIGSIPRSEPVELFTSNYDLLMEQALERHRVAYFDGFVGSHEAFLDAHAIDHDVLPPRWARLWKLHGSINWTLSKAMQVCRVQKAQTQHIIHPSHLKYDESRRMPYLAMIDRLRSFLRKPSAVLVICGYSFRDEHLNACLLEGLHGNSRTMVFATLFGKLDDFPDAKKLAGIAGNLNVLARDGGVIGTRTGAWITKDTPLPSDESVALDWVAVGGGPAKRAEFRLGDFARFGAFVAEMIGADLANLAYA